MAEITINIEDYITPSELKSITMDEIRHIIHRQYNNNEREIGRLITNVGYDFIFKAVSDAINEDAKEKITNTVKKLLEDDSHIRYVLWRRKDIWDKNESPAISILDEAIKDNRELINEMVKEAIKNYEFGDVKTYICEALDSMIYDKLFGGNNND